ncbi:MAG: zinc-binding dehydrogenase [Alphaproteobacteria bacterium]|nr:zinc-binding dehydrogenase [Alphaproteobacteria bacterium]
MSGIPNAIKSWYFAERPKGDLDDTTLALRTVPLPELADGEILVRNIYLSLDATNRVWLSDWDSYMEPVRLGEPMRGFIIGEVVHSKNAQFPKGALVSGLSSWSDYVVTNGEGFQTYTGIAGLDLAEAFGILTVAGPTAYVGLVEIGQPKPGDTVVVTAAAGAVGALVGQIAKIYGCRAIGIAGSAEKCAWLTRELGYDAAINYRTEDVDKRLAELAPDGIDIQFENVGGDILDSGLKHMKNGGRVIICGLISTYNSPGETAPGPKMFRNVIMRRLRIEGFVILDYLARYPEFHEKLLGWMRDGRLKYRLHVVDGLENAAGALKLLYTGGNHGKLMVKIGDPRA